MPMFLETYCSQCGNSFGPGDHGFSHCEDHRRNWMFYECHLCKVAHPGNGRGSPAVETVPGKKVNEWVFECRPSCAAGPEGS